MPRPAFCDKCFNWNFIADNCFSVKVPVKGCTFRCDNRYTVINKLSKMMTYNKTRNVNEYYSMKALHDALVKSDTMEKEIADAYREDRRRGGGAGGGDQMSNPGAIKQKMKDNRIQECKINLSEADRQEIKDGLEEFEEQHGKLERLSRNSMGRSKVDSYTGDPIK